MQHASAVIPLSVQITHFSNCNSGTVEFAEFVTSRGLEKNDDLGEVTNYANR